MMEYVCGIALVEKISESVVMFADLAVPIKIAILAIDDQKIDITVEIKFPNPDHRYRFDNVVPHCDWVREGMEVELGRDWDGYWIKQEISDYSRNNPIRKYRS